MAESVSDLMASVCCTMAGLLAGKKNPPFGGFKLRVGWRCMRRRIRALTSEGVDGSWKSRSIAALLLDRLFVSDPAASECSALRLGALHERAVGGAAGALDVLGDLAGDTGAEIGACVLALVTASTRTAPGPRSVIVWFERRADTLHARWIARRLLHRPRGWPGGGAAELLEKLPAALDPIVRSASGTSTSTSWAQPAAHASSCGCELMHPVYRSVDGVSSATAVRHA